MSRTIRSLFRIIAKWRPIITGSLLFVVLVANLDGQTPDSIQASAATAAIEQMLYEIKFQRLQQRFLDDDSELTKLSAARETLDLILTARALADSGDFLLAGMLLDEANAGWTPDEEPDSGSDPISPAPVGANSTSSWKRQVLLGSDFWQHRYDFAWGLQDSMISEGQGNPCLGLRLNYETGRVKQQFFAAALEGKVSRDYLSGYMTARGQQRFKQTLFEIHNHLEFSTFRDKSSPRFWEENLQGSVGLPFGRSFRIQTTQRLSFRAYPEQTDFYTSFFESETQLANNLQINPFTHLTLKYYYRIRNHAIIPEKDYHENYFGANWQYGSGIDKSIYLILHYRDRRHRTQVDSLYTRDYSHGYVNLESVWPLTNCLALGARLGLDWRCYGNPDAIIPDFRELELEPALIYTWIDGVRLKIGYLHRNRVHTSSAGAISDPDQSQADAALENYFSHGIVLGLDILTLKGLLLSLVNSYEVRRFPNSVTRDISDFSLYSDRNLNNLLLFFTWPISPQFELNCIANLDHDNDRKEEKNDSKSTLFSLELLYRF